MQRSSVAGLDQREKLTPDWQRALRADGLRLPQRGAHLERMQIPDRKAHLADSASYSPYSGAWHAAQGGGQQPTYVRIPSTTEMLSGTRAVRSTTSSRWRSNMKSMP